MYDEKYITKYDFTWSVVSHSEIGYGNRVDLLTLLVFSPLKVMHFFLAIVKSPPEISQ